MAVLLVWSKKENTFAFNVKEWHGCRSSLGVAGRGQFYYEATVTDEGLCRVGFSTDQASLDLGTCPFGYGFGGTGKKSNNRQVRL